MQKETQIEMHKMICWRQLTVLFMGFFAIHFSQAQDHTVPGSPVLPLFMTSSSSASSLPGPLNSASFSSIPGVTKIFTVTKSENDGREYRYLVLANSLRVLLVSDMTVEKSAVALNVHVGNYQNPKHRPGLAHFLEHMLLLSSEKYPEVGGFQQFISTHGGENNAYTADENTNYYFDVDSNALDSSLDRFVQSFITPLFDANYIEREKNAVNTEYLTKANDDVSREQDVYRTLFNPEHPATSFPVGTLENLADLEGAAVRDDLMSFYHTYYSANLMTLAVIGNHRLDDLQKMVESRFSQIRNHNKVIAEKYPKFFTPDFLPTRVNIKPIKEIRKLTFAFPVPDYSTKFRSKPLEFLSHLLGHEGSGSVLALLKNLGWAESLQVGEIFDNRQQSLFHISIDLTEAGARSKDQIISVIFDYLKIVANRGIAEWRFAELKQMAELNFRYREKQSVVDTANEMAQALQDYSPQDVLKGKYDYLHFNENIIKEALGHLRKENALITFVAPEASTSAASTFYHAPYSYVAGIPAVLELKPIYHQKLSLPERNIFIPKNIALKATPMLPSQHDQGAKNVPSLLLNSDQFRLWFLQDKVFRSPKAELNLLFKLPVLNGSLENVAKTELFVALLLDQLNEYAHPAQLAGLHYSITANSRGFDVGVGGYTDRQSLLVNKIVEAIAKADFTQNRFDKIKEDLSRDWRNEEKDLPYDVAINKISRLQYMPSWTRPEYAEGLKKTTFEQFKPFAAELLRGAKIEALFYGNLYSQDAIKLAALVDHQLLQKQSSRLPQMAKVIRLEHKENKSWLYVHPESRSDHLVALYAQALSPSVDDAAHMLLLGQILQPFFYTQLHTEKQLGYFVAVLPLTIKNVEANVFVIQSPHVNAEALVNEINNFLVNAHPYIKANFGSNKNSLLAQLHEPPVSLGEQSKRYWKSILLNDVEFTHPQELMNSVRKITPESLRKYYDAAFLQKNRRLWLSTDKLENRKDFEVIRSVAEYQQKQQGYLSP